MHNSQSTMYTSLHLAGLLQNRIYELLCILVVVHLQLIVTVQQVLEGRQLHQSLLQLLSPNPPNIAPSRQQTTASSLSFEERQLDIGRRTLLSLLVGWSLVVTLAVPALLTLRGLLLQGFVFVWVMTGIAGFFLPAHCLV